MNKISTIAVVALTARLLPLTAEAATLGDGAAPTSPPSVQQPTTSDTSGELSAVRTKTRNCVGDFLSQQGTLNDPPLFFPDVPDYVGWTNNPFTTFGLVDYAGLANQYIIDQGKPSLGTKVTCLVTERTLANGKAQITVALATTKALGFAQAAGALFGNYPTIFGAKAQDVVGGEDPALGPATLDVSFGITAAGAVLPDLVDVLYFNPCTYAPINYRFGSLTYENRSVLHINQEGFTDHPCTGLVFSREVVEILPAR